MNRVQAQLYLITGEYKPGVLGGVWAQYLHCYQQRATFSHIEGELQVGKVLRVLDFTQVHLSPTRQRPCYNTITLAPTHDTADFFHHIPHLAKLSFSQFLLEDEKLSRQLWQRGGISPRARRRQGWYSVSVVSADTLQAHNVCLSIVGDAGRQWRRHGGRQGGVRRGARVRGRLILCWGETLLHVHVQATGWREEEETDRVDFIERLL